MNDVIQLTTAQMDWLNNHIEVKCDSCVSLPSIDLIIDDGKRNKPDDRAIRISYSYDYETDSLRITNSALRYEPKYSLIFTLRRISDNEKIGWEVVSWNGNPDMWESFRKGNRWMIPLRYFFEIQHLMVNSPMNYFECEEKVAKRTNVKKKSKHSKGKSKVYLYKSYTLIRDWEQKIKLNSKHQIVCHCWTVRGHYRHYKSGKVVFVQSYEKGKKRNESLPKEYVILPKMDKEGIENVECL